MHDRDLSRRAAEAYETELDPEAKCFCEGDAPALGVCFNFGFVKNLMTPSSLRSAALIAHEWHFQEASQRLPVLAIKPVQPIAQFPKVYLCSVGTEESVPEGKDV